MKIKELDIIEFGCLKNARIILDDKLNILYGANESGKSTVMLFVRFMLYGLPRRSAKSGDRERSLSFSGHRAAGAMTLEHNGLDYRIERRAVGTTKTTEEKNFVCLQTGEKISEEPWEFLLGVSSEVFESSCSIGQTRSTDIKGAESASAIENMMLSADESVDVQTILAKLDKERRAYLHTNGKGGYLFDADTELASLRSKLQDSTAKYLSFN